MDAGWTRRAFLASACSLAPATAASKGQTFPPERVRFADSATENEVLRLTNPEHSCVLPPPFNRSSSSKGNFLIYASDRAGSLQAYRMEVRSGESKLLTEAAKLDPQSITVTPDEKSICFFDGDALQMINLGNLRDREICRTPGRRGSGLTVSDDGVHAAFIASNGGRTAKLMLAALNKGGAQPVVEVPTAATAPLIRPRGTAVLYRAGSEGLWLVNFDGAGNRRLKTSGTALGLAQWSPDGRTVLYLSGNELREYTPESDTDALVAKTSQFVSFGRNSDASVFVGASGSKAGPYVLLLLRITRREMAICEHRATNPSQVNPVFSPSSQRIYFQSDRNGKMAIYSMAVDRLVEKTET